MTNSNITRVIRYIRPVSSRKNDWGITIQFDIDYAAKIVHASWAVSNGDNFSKEVGRSRAEMNQQRFPIRLDDVDKYLGLVPALIENFYAISPTVKKIDTLWNEKNYVKVFNHMNAVWVDNRDYTLGS